MNDSAFSAPGTPPTAPRRWGLTVGPVQYLSVNDAETLAPLERVEGPARVLAAAYLGRTRLIDNVAV